MILDLPILRLMILDLPILKAMILDLPTWSSPSTGP